MTDSLPRMFHASQRIAGEAVAKSRPGRAFTALADRLNDRLNRV